MNSLPKGWVETKLANIIATANTGLDAIKRAPIVIDDTGIRCFRIQDASQSKEYIRWGFTNVNQQNYDKFKLLTGDILIARTGNSIGVNFLVQYDTKAVFNNGLIRLRVNEFVRYDFLYKIISSHVFDRYIQSIAYGTSTQPNMQINSLLNFSLLLPPLSEQKSIAKLLASFDEKIELLREQNETLETLAQTIFKEWFVNFNYPDATGEMEGSELGEIPKGWRVGSVGNILILHYGKALKTQNRTGMGFPVYGSNGVVGFHEEYLVKGPGIIVGRKGTMGAVVWCDNDFFPIDTAFYVTDSLEVGDLYFHYFLLKKQDFERLGSDSAVPGLNRNSVYIIDTVIPAKTCIENFSSTIKPLFEKIKNNTSQIQTLTKIRDTLLPKLMSGEVRVN